MEQKSARRFKQNPSPATISSGHPPPTQSQDMDEEDLEIPLEAMFKTQVGIKDKDEIVDLPTNEDNDLHRNGIALLIKPHGFKTPPIKVVASNLQRAWKFTKGVTIMPNKHVNNTLVCLFCDPTDMKKVEDAGAWTVRNSHLMIARWPIDIALENVVLDSVNFWVHIRGIPPDRLSSPNISAAAGRAGQVLQVKWGDSTLPKWYTVPKALVRVRVTEPLYPGFRLKKRSGSCTWVSFKYEKLGTFCYDCGILGHDQGACPSEEPVDPDRYGPWLRYDESGDTPPPKMNSPTQDGAINQQKVHDSVVEEAPDGKEKDESDNFTFPELQRSNLFCSVPLAIFIKELSRFISYSIASSKKNPLHMPTRDDSSVLRCLLDKTELRNGRSGARSAQQHPLRMVRKKIYSQPPACRSNCPP